MRFCDGCGILQPSSLGFRNLMRIVSRHEDFASVAVLFLTTALTIYPLFTGDYTKYWASIEAAYISDSIFISANFPNVGWFPYWYGGLPFHLSYPPLFIYAVSFLHTISGLSVGHSYRVLVAVAYSAAPPALYLIAKFLTKEVLPSFFAALTYSFVPTFLPGLLPSHIVQLTVYGEGPHFFGLALAFFALLQLLRCMTKPTWVRCLTTSILIASVALTNLVAFFALAFLMVIAVATETIYRNDVAILAFLLSGVIAFGLIAFQYDLEFIQYSEHESIPTASALSYLILLLPLLMLGAFLVRRYLFRYLAMRANSKGLIFVSLWIVVLGVIVVGYMWFQLQLFPQPKRYVPEFDAGIGLLVGLVLTKVDKALLNWGRAGMEFAFPRKVWVLAAVLVLLVVCVVSLLPLSLTYTVHTSVLSNVPEFQTASWLSEHVTDQRVFATGSVAFWLNVFSDVSQVRGGSDQGATNNWWADVNYQILKGADPGTSVLWAQAWDVKYIVVTFRNASVYNLDYANPHKFDNFLPLRYYIGGYGVYEVPLSHPSLVEAVSVEAVGSLAPITNVLDIRDLAAYDYLTQVKPGSTAAITYHSPNPDLLEVTVSGATADTAILVKMTFDTRWKAEVNGEPVEIARLGPDFMVAYPNTDGDYQLTLRLQPTEGEAIGLYGTIATIILLIVVSVSRLNARARKVKYRFTI